MGHSSIQAQFDNLEHAHAAGLVDDREYDEAVDDIIREANAEADRRSGYAALPSTHPKDETP